MSERIFNFSAGPAVLPEVVLQKAKADIWNYEDSGVGVLEHSHRGPEFTSIIENAEKNIRTLAGVPDDYSILFLQGGASTQFYMVPMNFLGKDQTADYINTGTWSKKAIKEAKNFGSVHVAGSSEDDGFKSIPSQVSYSSSPRYVHFTSNNTISGTQFTAEPEGPGPLVCDASSDIFSRPIDIKKYGLIYAGAQKNLGPSGMCLVIIQNTLLEQGASGIPTMCQYRTHSEKGSCFNTPPTFPIYVVGEVVKWLLELGGLEAIHKKNTETSGKLYEYLDKSSMFHCPVAEGSRSQMNVVFRGPSEDSEKQFIAEAKAAGLAGLKGHRSVGGMRASIYNAFPAEGVDRLLAFMTDFESKHG